MKSIKVIIEHLDDTLAEAEDYYADYVVYKDDVPKLANMALEMAKIHLDLYLKWHSVVVSLINEYKATNGEAPDAMKAVWEYEHSKLTEEYNELKYKIMNA